jgi:transcription termination factor Rho
LTGHLANPRDLSYHSAQLCAQTWEGPHVTEISEATPATTDAQGAPVGKKSGGLNSMLLPELKQLAGGLGIKGAGTMRKGALVDAIKAAQGGGRSSTPERASSSLQASGTSTSSSTSDSNGTPTSPDVSAATSPAMVVASVAAPTELTAAAESSIPSNTPFDASAPTSSDASATPSTNGRTSQSDRSSQNDRSSQADRSSQSDRSSESDRSQSDRSSRNGQEPSGNSTSPQDRQSNGQNGSGGQSGQQSSSNREGYDDRGGRSRSRSRNRNRDRNYRDRDRRPQGGESEPSVSDDDVLIPAAGILDLLDNYAFVRTSGYLPGPNDVYVAMSMVRKFGLRKGDAITGAVRQPRDGERREKYNPMVRIDTVNGAEPEASRSRVEFSKLVPLYAAERLRLETEPGILTTRLIDIVAPIGKGQRGLIVSPSKAGKTLVMQAIANAITTNNPECHLMVVLVDERPEEVTDMQRAVKGEVIASTFDRPADDHTTVAELAIERAKRLVELGHDVVVLLDSITRLGRAYNLAAPASGRILSGGVDSSALYPPKRFFGAARNIEDGGSLTILATALIETGSKMDEVIFEEFKGTGNLELRLRREYADKRIFPAIDVDASGTRREELLMGKDELQIVWKLRRVLSGLDGQQALELLLNKLKSTKTNIEFLMQVNKTTPTAAGLRGSDDD